ncbi:MAG: hypothetical protein ABI119_03335 [Gemmatimonadaceae bacterium]
MGYDPNEARDKDGKWTSGGGGAAHNAIGHAGTVPHYTPESTGGIRAARVEKAHAALNVAARIRAQVESSHGNISGSYPGDTAKLAAAGMRLERLARRRIASGGMSFEPAGVSADFAARMAALKARGTSSVKPKKTAGPTVARNASYIAKARGAYERVNRPPAIERAHNVIGHAGRVKHK